MPGSRLQTLVFAARVVQQHAHLGLRGEGRLLGCRIVNARVDLLVVLARSCSAHVDGLEQFDDLASSGLAQTAVDVVLDTLRSPSSGVRTVNELALVAVLIAGSADEDLLDRQVGQVALGQLLVATRPMSRLVQLAAVGGAADEVDVQAALVEAIDEQAGAEDRSG